MKSKCLRGSLPSFSHIAASISLLFMFGSAHAAPLELIWSGTIVQVLEDTGLTLFSGTVAGDKYAGNFVYDDQPNNEFCDPGSCSWDWSGAPYGAALNQGPVFNPATALNFSSSELSIEDDADTVGDPNGLMLINAVLNPDITATTPFDLWEIGAGHGVFDSPDFLFISVDALWLDTTAFNDPSFRPIPPSLPQPDAFAFIFQEVTSDGGSFLAIGLLDTLETGLTPPPVPIPAAVWLFGSALGLLGWMRRKAA